MSSTALNRITTYCSNYIVAHPGVVIATIIALLAQKIISCVMQSYNLPTQAGRYGAFVQLSSAGLGIIVATKLLGLSIAPHALLVAVVAPIIIGFNHGDEASRLMLHTKKGELDIAHGQIRSLEANLNSVNQQLGLLTQAQETMRQQSLQDRTTISQLRREKTASSSGEPSDVESLRQQLTTARSVNASLTKKMTHLEQTIAALQQKTT